MTNKQTMTEEIERILAPAIDVRAPYAKVMIAELVKVKTAESKATLIAEITNIITGYTKYDETTVSCRVETVPVIWEVDNLLDDIKQAIGAG